MSRITYKLGFAFLLGMMLATLVTIMQKPWEADASVEAGNSYLSTTTPAVADLANLCPASAGMASSTTGTLGSVNILLTGGSPLTIYDATTSNASLRSSDQSTTSIIMADFPVSPTVGSYHFDIEFKRGLLIDYNTTGTGVASTTISFRCGS